MSMNENILHLTDHLVSISEFSKGKTAKIFDDVKNNNSGYVVLKNNQPTAVLLSLDMYKDIATKAAKMESLLERIEETRLFNLAEKRMKSFDPETAIDFEQFVKEQGFDLNEIMADANSVEIE